MPRCDGIIITGGLHLGYLGVSQNNLGEEMCWVREGKREGGRGKWKGLPRDGHRGGTYFGTRQVTVCFVQGDPRKRQPPLPTCVMPMPPSAAPRLALLPRARVLTGWILVFSPKRRHALCGKTGRSPQSPPWKRACCVPPWAEQRGLVNGPSCCLEEHEIASGRFWTGIQLFPCTRFCCSHNLWMQLETHNRCSSVASALLGTLSAHK
jgi:hypothetical protein